MGKFVKPFENLIFNILDINEQNKTKLQTLRGIPTNFSGSDKVIIPANSQKEFIFKLYCPLSNSMLLRELIKGNLEI